jgi:hypothetical protein
LDCDNNHCYQLDCIRNRRNKRCSFHQLATPVGQNVGIRALASWNTSSYLSLSGTSIIVLPTSALDPELFLVLVGDWKLDSLFIHFGELVVRLNIPTFISSRFELWFRLDAPLIASKLLL